ncbi:MAG: DUF1761 domain-containing protein [Candidatus Eremiobacteraeota bacterium]|nr:DUF1761 domain-containing protein [Candidatus Eremiobacteraeota bacterium]
MKGGINHLAVIVAAIAYFVWQGIWYTVFGNQWLALVGWTNGAQAHAAMSPTPIPYIVGFIMALILAYVTAIALADSSQPGAPHGVQFALFMGIGIFATILLTEYVFERRPLGLWLMNAAIPVTGFAIIGAIIGGWRSRVRAT